MDLYNLILIYWERLWANFPLKLRFIILTSGPELGIKNIKKTKHFHAYDLKYTMILQCHVNASLSHLYIYLSMKLFPVESILPTIGSVLVCVMHHSCHKYKTLFVAGREEKKIVFFFFSISNAGIWNGVVGENAIMVMPVYLIYIQGLACTKK